MVTETRTRSRSIDILPRPYTVRVSDEAIQDLKSRIANARWPVAATYEGTHTALGMTGAEMDQLARYWLERFDWRKSEAYQNEFHHYTALLEPPIQLHFIHERSSDPSAIPLVLLHGWPGSYLEFLDSIRLLTEPKEHGRAGPAFHVVIPSMPGYGWSTAPPPDQDYLVSDVARLVDMLMTGLGYSKYIAQGGDIGASVARILAVRYQGCQAVHVNFCPAPPPPTFLHSFVPLPMQRAMTLLPTRVADFSKRLAQSVHDLLYSPLDTYLHIPKDLAQLGLTADELTRLERGNTFASTGRAYAAMHGTRPATLSYGMTDSPLALLAWVGEKFRDWTDLDPTYDKQLEGISLYWFAKSMSTSLYPYRRVGERDALDYQGQDYIRKPMGWSDHPKELFPRPRSWVALTGNLVWYRTHNAGGHFAAMENPEVFTDDLRDFVTEVKRLGKLNF